MSVIVAARNAEPYLAGCLDSLLDQTYEPIQIVVVDDSSTDNTWDILSRYADAHSRITCERSASRRMAAATRNRCIELAEGYYVAIQDADDICTRDRIARLVSHAEGCGADFVSSGHFQFDDSGIFKTVPPGNLCPGRFSFLLGSPFCHAATLFRRSVLTSVGGYRVSRETERGQDYDLFMRLYAAGFSGMNVTDILYGYRVDRETMARRKLRYRIDECRIRRRGFSELGMMPWAAPFVLKPLAAHLFCRWSRR